MHFIKVPTVEGEKETSLAGSGSSLTKRDRCDLTVTGPLQGAT